jgi:WD40 repeat protein
LHYYDQDDRALFAGRDADVRRFARVLDEPGTCILVLHGESGTGKSSFLRAGVIPYLEEECYGYHFVRDRSAADRGPVLFVRSTNDLAGQLADALTRFCHQPLPHRLPEGATGEAVEIDLPGILPDAAEVVSLRGALLADAGLLGRLLTELGNRLPYTPVLVIDQAEEVFTLARTPEEAERRKQALEMLRRAGEAEGNFKVIVALRTEYYGRFVDGLRRGARHALAVREYLLTDFNEAQLTDAILRPTEFAQYGLRYAEGVAQSLAGRVVAYCRNRQDSVLPLAQVICAQLYDLVCRRPGKEIREEDIAAIGGIEGGMKRHVEDLVARHLPDRRDRKAFQRLLTRLYLRQPDGALTTALMLEKDVDADRRGVEHYWDGRLPLGELLEMTTRPDVRLLRRSTLRIGGEAERAYVSLGHDALAKVAADWDEELSRGRRIRNSLLAVGGALSLAAVLAVLSIWALYERGTAREKTNQARGHARAAEEKAAEARKAEREARQHAYVAHINLVQKALEEGNVAHAIELLDTQRPLPGHEDFRSFPWYYFWSYCHQDLIALRGHAGPALAVAFSPDGKSLASGGVDGAVRLWDVVARRERAALRGHAGQASSVSVAFSPDGKTLAAGHSGGAVRLWDVVAQQELAVLEAHVRTVNAVAFSPDGKSLASGAEDGTVRLWDMAARKERAVLEGGKGPVLAVAFSPDSKTLTADHSGGAIRLWDVAAQKELAVLQHPESWLRSLAFSPDGKTLASGREDGTVRLWDVAAQQKRAALKGPAAPVLAVAFSPDGKSLAAAYLDQTVRLWDVAARQELAALRGHAGEINAMAFSPDGKALASAAADGTVRLWDAATPREQTDLERHSGGAYAVAFSPDGKFLASTAWAEGPPGVLFPILDQTVRVWDVPTGRQRAALKGHTGTVYAMAFSPDGKALASAAADGTIRRWDVATGQQRGSLPWRPPKEAWAAAFSPDGKYLACNGDDHAVLLWDLDTAQCSALTGHTDQVGTVPFSLDSKVSAVAFSPDGKSLASSAEDGAVRLWDVATRQERAFLGAHWGGAYAVAFSPDGKSLASGGADGAVRLWDIATRQERAGLTGHTGTVYAMAFSPDGKALASADSAKVVRLWDVAARQELAVLRGHTGLISSVAFSSDGKALACAGERKTVRLWSAATAREIFDYSQRCADAGPGDTQAQHDLVLACWGLYLHLDLQNEEDRSRARRLLQQGRDVLLRLQEKHPHHEELVRWVGQFEAALKDLSPPGG